MKKIVSLLLVICILITSAALADTGKTGVIFYAQEGLDFVLMENRHTLADDSVYNRMQQVYEEIHLSEHYSEMDVQAHENGIGADINQELQEMNLPLTAYDYVIYDSFELQLQQEYEDMLVDGRTLLVAFDMNLERNVHPVVLRKDAQTGWICLEHENVQMQDDGVLTVRFDALGTVLVLVEIEEKMSDNVDYDIGFTPSVAGKAAPDVIAPDKSDPSVIALIYNEQNELISRVPDKGYLVVTPVSRRDRVEDKEVRERLEWAYNQIMTTPRIGDLPAQDSTEGVGGAIDSVLDASGFDDMTSDDMIVRDLFDASLYGTEYVDALNDDGHYIEIIFDLKVNPSDPLIIMITNDNAAWQVLSWEDYEINPDGSVTVRLQEMGTIAILVDAINQSVSGVKSPKTGE